MDKINFHKLMTILVALSSIDASEVYDFKNCNCVHVDYCQKVKIILEQSNNHSNITFCNPHTKEMVCCPEEPKKTISEKKCEEFVKIEGYCQPVGLIMDGSPIRPHDFPFMVSVQLKRPTEKNYTWSCGGSLIDPKWVLTAAHCFDDVLRYPDTEVFVFLGAHNKNDSGIRIKAKQTLHPQYGTTDPFADLALLELDREININTTKIRPICLAKTNGSEHEYFRILGWGKFDGEYYPDTLLTGKLRQSETKNCKGNIPADRCICAGPEDVFGDVCSGDSGGPLLAGYPGQDTCLLALIAVVSNGGQCDVEGSYTSHTRVSYYRDWIERTVWPTEK